MSDIFKLRVCIGNANIELEGEGELVHTIFSELRENGLANLSVSVDTHQVSQNVVDNKIDITQGENDRQVDESEQIRTGSIKLPNIKDIVMKDLPKTETEWLLIYALYASEEGTSAFTAETLRQLYHDSNRFTETRNKNFSTNLKKAVTSDWFVAINNTDYVLSEVGKKAAYEILQRTVEKNSAKKVKKAVSTVKSSYEIKELDLDEEQRKEFKQYVLSFNSLNNMEKAVIIAYGLKKYGISEIDENTIFTALRIADQPASYDIKASLNNGKRNKSYFISGEMPGKFKLHHLGEDCAKELEKARGIE